LENSIGFARNGENIARNGNCFFLQSFPYHDIVLNVADESIIYSMTHMGVELIFDFDPTCRKEYYDEEI
jgi:hypothetical protein